jgi:hypothetical protein
MAVEKHVTAMWPFASTKLDMSDSPQHAACLASHLEADNSHQRHITDKANIGKDPVNFNAPRRAALAPERPNPPAACRDDERFWTRLILPFQVKQQSWPDCPRSCRSAV